MRSILYVIILSLITIDTHGQKLDIIDCEDWKTVHVTEDSSISENYVITSDLGIDIKKKNRVINCLADLNKREIKKLKKQGCKSEAAVVQIIEIELVGRVYYLSCAGYSKFRTLE